MRISDWSSDVCSSDLDDRFANRAGWEGSLRGGAVWRVTPALRLRAAAYSGLRLPTLNELYRPFVVFPVTTQANAALRNERLKGYEAGIDLAPAHDIALPLTLFDNRVAPAVANFTFNPTPPNPLTPHARDGPGGESSAGTGTGNGRV